MLLILGSIYYDPHARKVYIVCTYVYTVLRLNSLYIPMYIRLGSLFSSSQNIMPILIIIIFILQFSAHGRVYEVAISKDLCQEPHEYCNTWEYYQKNQTLISQSNTEWKFMPGIHHAKSGITAFQKVRNVTIRGVSANCTLFCNGSNLCQLLFVNSSDVQISNINVIYPNRFLMTNKSAFNTTFRNSNDICFDYKTSQYYNNPFAYDHCIYNRAWIFVNVANVNIENITFEGYHTHWAIIYSQRNGFWNVKNINFTKMSPGSARIPSKGTNESNQHVTVIVHPRKWHSIKLLLFFDKISFFGSNEAFTEKAIPVASSIHIICDNYWEKEGRVNITMNNIKCVNVPLLQINSINNPGLSIVLKNSFASINRGLLDDTNNLMSPALSILLSDKSTCGNKFNKSGNSIQIKGVVITGFVGKFGCGILHVVENYCNSSFKGVLLLKENRFFNNTGLDFDGIFHAEYNRYNKNNQEDLSNYEIIITHNNFTNNTLNHKDCRHATYYPNISLFHGRQHCQVTYSNFLNGYYPDQRKISKGVVHLSGFMSYGRIIYQANVIMRNTGNAISLNNTDLQLQMPGEYSNFYNNKEAHIDILENEGGLFGGGLFLGGNSKLLLTNNLTFQISSNSVFNSGGGIYVQGNFGNGTTLSPCFYQFVDEYGNFLKNTSIEDVNVTVAFQHNNAKAGNEVFAPHLDSCHLHTVFDANTSDVFNKTFSFPHVSNFTRHILLSNPRHIYTCKYPTDEIEISIKEHPKIQLYPGQDLKLDIIVVADRVIRLALPLSIVCYREIFENTSSLPYYHPRQSMFLKPSCNTVVMPFSELNEIRNSSKLFLLFNVPLMYQDFMESNLYYHSERLDVEFLSSCPPGFTLIDKECQCQTSLRNINVLCIINNNNISFVLPTLTWIGISGTVSDNKKIGLQYSKSCPKRYCNQSSNVVNVTLDLKDFNQQCNQGRVDVLCSKCSSGQGENFGGTPACTECSYAALLYIVPYILLNLLLVIVICTFNLTISTRSINGILFYLHVLSINRDILPKPDASSPFMAIAAIVDMLSLNNPGVKMCFYPGMDSFAVVMFSLIGPITFLVIVGSAFFLPKVRCINIHKVHMTVGPRITPVLATMIILSFTKFFDIVLFSLLYTDLCDVSTQKCWTVWYFDGTLKYFSSLKHIVLGVISLAILLFFLIPVMTTIIFGDLLKRCIRKQWYWNFIDTFYCSFKFRFGFWIGIRLLFRIILMTKILLTDSESILLTICIAHFIIFFQMLFTPFRHLRFERCLPRRLREKYFTEEFSRFVANMNDNIFMINIAVLFTFLLYELKPDNIQWIVLLSEMAALLQFSIILIYHTFEYSPFGPKIVQCFKYTFHFFQTRKIFLLKKASQQDSHNSQLSSHELNIPQINLVLRPLNEQRDSSRETSEESEVEITVFEGQISEEEEACDDREGVEVNMNTLTTPLLVEKKEEKGL